MQDMALGMVRMMNLFAEASAAVRLDAITSARNAGASWTAIGAVMGMTRQQAHKKFGAVVGEPKHVHVKANNPPGGVT